MLILADMPGPVHGMSNVNSSFFRNVKASGMPVVVINTVPSYAEYLFGSKLWLALKTMHTFWCWIKLVGVLIFSSTSVVYRPINGGVGQIYDLVYLGICRLARKNIYIHHHSFNYLNSRSFLFAFLNTVSGSKTKHIVLGERMAGLLTSSYGIKESQITVISNIAFFKVDGDACLAVGDRKCELVVGHLANLCEAKGVGDFVSLCRELNSRGVRFRAKIAGPFSDSAAEEIVRKSCVELKEVEYYGPLYGSEKDAFFESLDVFVFPSKYDNEAEPLVLYESGKNGVLNIGTRQGCMGDVINQLQGVSINSGPLIIQTMADVLQLKLKEGALTSRARSERTAAFIKANKMAKVALNNLLLDMRCGDVSATK